MSDLNKHIEQANERLIQRSGVKIGLDLETGKMGCCLYFFKRAQWLSEPKYQKLAEKLLDDIFEEIGNEPILRTPYELAQIGMGIDYLIKQKHIKGNINSILGDLDSLIFRKLAFEGILCSYQVIGIIPTLYFIYTRIQQQKKGSDATFMLEEISIKLFNDLYRSLDSKFYNEPLLFNIIDYKLPQFLFTVSKIYSLQFYNYRLSEVLKEISGLILSRIPVLHSNRLYLLWSLLHLKEATGFDTWDEQIDILTKYIDYKRIIYTELQDKDVFIQDGVAGIYLLLCALKDTSSSILFDKKLFRKRIEESGIWKDEQAFKNLGLINGFSGLLWIYDLITNEK